MNYDKTNMNLAIAALVRGDMTGEAAAAFYGVPRSTLYRLAKKIKYNI